MTYPASAYRAGQRGPVARGLPGGSQNPARPYTAPRPGSPGPLRGPLGAPANGNAPLQAARTARFGMRGAGASLLTRAAPWVVIALGFDELVRGWHELLSTDYHAGTGWEMKRSCAGVAPSRGPYRLPYTSCGTLFGAADADRGIGGPNVGPSGSVYFKTFIAAGDPFGIPGFSFGLPSQYWEIVVPNGDPVPDAGPFPALLPGRAPGWVVPEPFPINDPNSLPIQKPVSTPRAMPYRLLPMRVPNPHRSPSERTVRGPFTVRPPFDQIEYELGKPPKVTPRPNPYVRARPKKGEKEKKARTNVPIVRILRPAVNAVTETVDVIEALHKALPKKYRATKYQDGNGWNSTPLQKLERLWKHWKHLDVEVAIKELAKNQLEDAILGRAGRGAAEFSRSHSLGPLGVQAGPTL